MGSFFRDALEDAAEWAKGRWWVPRLLLLAYLAYVAFRHFRDPEYSSFLFGGATFGVHELGHVIFSPLGELLGIAGGSLAQLLAPILVGIGFLYWQRDGEPQRDYFALAVAAFWLAFSLHNLALYVGDARHQDLPLLGMSSDPVHDWNYLLGWAGLLAWDQRFAGLIRLAAAGISLLAFLFAGWLLKRMAAD
jgi:hypothetical protein